MEFEKPPENKLDKNIIKSAEGRDNDVINSIERAIESYRILKYDKLYPEKFKEYESIVKKLRSVRAELAELEAKETRTLGEKQFYRFKLDEFRNLLGDSTEIHNFLDKLSPSVSRDNGEKNEPTGNSDILPNI